MDVEKLNVYELQTGMKRGTITMKNMENHFILKKKKGNVKSLYEPPILLMSINPKEISLT